MKKSIVFSLILIMVLSLESCKEKSEKKDLKTIEKKNAVKINQEKSSINWTAYKTTDKIPVKGSFKSFKITSSPENNGSVNEVLNNLKFSIPVSSLFTNDSIRDEKLKKFFFGSMVNTAEISGTISTNQDATSGSVSLLMNGISNDLPITISKTDGMIHINSEMSLGNWKAQAALKALNVACFDLHKGADGISKTWNEVKIEVNLAIH